MQRKREKGQREEEEENCDLGLKLDLKYPSSSSSPEMACSDLFQFNSSPKAKNKLPLCVSNGVLFLFGALIAFLLVWSFSDYVSQPPPDPNFRSELTDLDSTLIPKIAPPRNCSDAAGRGVDLGFDPPEKNFYDDPDLGYSIGKAVKNWDEKRKEWLRLHPSFSVADGGAGERVLVVSGSQSGPCKNPMGDHLLLRFLKNKVDYCRIHGYEVWYNNVLIQPEMYSFWAKLPAVKAAMVAHPEAEWIWWVDSDALFTDMDFKLPLERYRAHNLVVHGWDHMIHVDKSWTGLNAGVFMIRNCQWSMDFIEQWAGMGPQSPDFVKWGQIQRSILKDKMFPESDDQAALIYLLIEDKTKWAPKVYLEGGYYFEGYWLDIIGTLENITAKYEELEWEERGLRRRHAEAVSECYAAHREAYVKDWGGGRGSMRRPPVTHFAGCQPCSGDHNMKYSGHSCYDGMIKALNFADNQVLRNFGFMRPDLLDSATVKPVPFDAAV